ncbi:MAG: Asp-tRNA(Asn)/Glu-tRNA(Gln) amidotransferase subunit GatB [Acidimicrobiia bacterium]|nr:Asp-tRNA(Asn)/Glu-tRNA(Gln) amidotransferase subunit GatB [Acidimicrobiia bacterium]
MTDTAPVVEPTLPDGWELVVGLEVHCELSTATKLFCGCRNRFGDDPNTNVCPVCLGLPGSLPVLNGSAVDYAMRLGLALNCTVNPAVFARKNYFYPDMPKDYQVTQYDLPTSTDGHLELPDGTVVGIERAHIEEDTGKSTHVGGSGRIHDATHSLVDYNRAGIPLVEIVSRPDIRTVESARAYASELRAILTSIDVSDAKMEEGSMRVDANVSVRPIGSDELRTRCEVKNINSIRSLGRAIEYEANRHIDLYDSGQTPRQETRHWDEANGRSTSGRSKEDSEDYRYFPEPDLVPLDPTGAQVDAIAEAMPPLPSARRHALADAAGLEAGSVALVVERGQDELALAAISAGADGGIVIKHLENNLADGTGELTAESFAALAAMEADGRLSATQAKTVLTDLVASGGDPTSIAAAHGFEAMDTGELDAILDRLIADNPDEWGRFVDGDRKVQGFFVGQIMKATKGQADGKVVNMLMQQRAAG